MKRPYLANLDSALSFSGAYLAGKLTWIDSKTKDRKYFLKTVPAGVVVGTALYVSNVKYVRSFGYGMLYGTIVHDLVEKHVV